MYKIIHSKDGKIKLKTSLRGKALIFHPLLNKSNAFSEHEREILNLDGKLPPVYEDIEKQTDRAIRQYNQFKSDEAKSIYLHALYNTNEILFYALVTKYINEITDKLYTPTVGLTVKDYSLQYRHPRGMFMSYTNRDKIKKMLANRTNRELDLIVISDGEAILGIGDQGIGGMGIPVAKAAMHVASGGISPYRIAPLFIDVGTNNKHLHDDPFYLGIRQERLAGAKYQGFVKELMAEIFNTFPKAVIHFEDFSKNNARWLMQTYGDQHPCFNDDIQGTATIVLAAIITALKYKDTCISEQRIVLVGPGAAGLGIIETLSAYIKTKINDDKAVKGLLWLVGRHGLVLRDTENSDLLDYAKDKSSIEGWDGRDLKDVVKNVKPTILIGVTGKAGLFDKEIVSHIVEHVEEPIILPLSNPSAQSECIPQEVMASTDKKIYMATGSPFTVTEKKESKGVSQCNNIFAFPGIAAGMIACQAKKLTTEMMISAAEKISEYTYENYKSEERITPILSDLPEVTKAAAMGVIESAIRTGNSELTIEISKENFETCSWQPHYLEYEYDESIS